MSTGRQSGGEEPWALVFVRDYALPAVVFFFMVRFLVREVISPFFGLGMHRHLTRRTNNTQDGEAVAPMDNDKKEQ